MTVLPGYAGRLGRLAFLGRSLALLGAMVLITMVLLWIAIPRGAGPGAGRAVLVVMAMVVPVYLYGSIGLQVRRVRDLGWSPLVVVGGCAVLTLADAVLAHAVPTLAATHRTGTGMADVVNGILGIALLFKAGRADDDEPTDVRRTRLDLPLPHATRPRAWPEPTVIPATPTGFGRRPAP